MTGRAQSHSSQPPTWRKPATSHTSETTCKTPSRHQLDAWQPCSSHMPARNQPSNIRSHADSIQPPGRFQQLIRQMLDTRQQATRHTLPSDQAQVMQTPASRQPIARYTSASHRLHASQKQRRYQSDAMQRLTSHRPQISQPPATYTPPPTSQPLASR